MLTLSMLVIVLLGAQPDSEPDPEPAPAPAVLGGPAVELGDMAPTLVERDYEGMLRDLGVRPEVAAIGLLGLTDAEREAVDRLIDARATLVDRVVSENLDLFTELQTARAAGQNGAEMGGDAGEARTRERSEASANRREVADRFYQALEPLLAQEPLAAHFAAALPAEKREAYHTLILEYTRAQEEASSEAPRQRAGTRGGPRARPEGMAGIRTEIRAAVERGFADRNQRTESLIARLGLTPEQEREVRDIIRAFGESVGGNPTQEQRRELMQRILAVLPPEQRSTALEAIRKDRP